MNTVDSNSGIMAVSSMEQAVSAVSNGDDVYIGGFGFAQPFSATHELIRQDISDLHVIRSSGDILLDQLVGAGCVEETTIAHCWNAIGPTATSAYRRAVEDSIPCSLDVEEFGLGLLVLRLFAGARRLPFIPAGPVEGTGQFEQQTFSEKFMPVEFDGKTHYVMRPLNPDVSIVHVRYADKRGNAQLTGPRGEIKYGAMAADTLIVTAEEIISSEEIQDTPEYTIVPDFMVDYVVESPGGSHPSGVHGAYNRDIDYLAYYGETTDTREGFEAFLDKWIYGVTDRAEYRELLETENFLKVSV